MPNDAREAIALAIADADDRFGYSIQLTRLVDGVSTYTLDYKDGSPVLEFPSHAEASDHASRTRDRMRADAILALLADRDGVIMRETIERCATVVDAERDFRLKCEQAANARKAKSEARDFQSMKIAAVHIAAAIRALESGAR